MQRHGYTTPDIMPYLYGDIEYEYSVPLSVGGAGNIATSSGTGVYVIPPFWTACQLQLLSVTFTGAGKCYFSLANPSATNNFNNSQQLNNISEIWPFNANAAQVFHLSSQWFSMSSPYYFVIDSAATAFLTFAFRRPRHVRKETDLFAVNNPELQSQVPSQYHDNLVTRANDFLKRIGGSRKIG